MGARVLLIGFSEGAFFRLFKRRLSRPVTSPAAARRRRVARAALRRNKEINRPSKTYRSTSGLDPARVYKSVLTFSTFILHEDVVIITWVRALVGKGTKMGETSNTNVSVGKKTNGSLDFIAWPSTQRLRISEIYLDFKCNMCGVGVFGDEIYRQSAPGPTRRGAPAKRNLITDNRESVDHNNCQ
ncbi:hypothetical protein EVAR_80129_1 [Eumeta japonica]|uniref:Uncharacterized protein n=1 Tax=Eumeta variegata TaxID=151549 RepID=A0A4C1UE99_EUMVA|nr:hypothetical protein EVAR_80129_1 [Eumeta japonica]